MYYIASFSRRKTGVFSIFPEDAATILWSQSKRPKLRYYINKKVGFCQFLFAGFEK